jgi:hypothetical protein
MLSTCLSCTRRVREQVCPFCGADPPASLRATPPRRSASVCPGRAALVALGAGTVMLASACSTGSGGPSIVPADAASAVDGGGDAQGD